MNIILQNDIDNVVSEDRIPWHNFKDKTVFITGATGLIGSQLIYILLNADKKYNLNLKLIAVARNKEKAEKIFGKYIDGKTLCFIYQDIREELKVAEDVHYIVHAASETASVSFVKQPVDTIDVALQGVRNIMLFAKEKQIVSGVFLSTMEIYGLSDRDTIKESEYGYLNPLEVRSCYPESKRMCECMISSYENQFHIPFKIARLTQTFGPGVELNDNRVFAQFAKAIVEKRDIILHSEGKTVRNYLYTADAVSAILTILCKGKSGEAYNVANKDTSISIYDMALLLINKYSERNLKIIIEVEEADKYGYCKPHRTCINTEKLEALGWKPRLDLETAFERMIKVMEDERNGTSTYI